MSALTYNADVLDTSTHMNMCMLEYMCTAAQYDKQTGSVIHRIMTRQKLGEFMPYR